MRILVVEDEAKIADAIAARLKKEQYSVDISYDGEEGEYNALTGIYNLVILDVMLPFKNGFEILKEMKEESIDSKVIMLTAKGELDDKLKGLTSGADDYMTKPFHMEELVARVNIQLRKEGSGVVKDYIEYSDIQLNLKKSTLTCTTTNESIEVGAKELLILEYFLNNQDIVISKEQIYDKVWGIERDTESNNLEAYLSFIRKKLRSIGSKVNIKVLRNIGYKLEDKDE
ncbi:MAG: response regulator transcription factor [Bacilli bacterium]|nr:response regulator transcription factor [Bacilli bacterium]